MERGKHQHYIHQRIVTVLQEIDEKWTLIASDMSDVTSKATCNYEAWRPLIRYLELDMLRVTNLKPISQPLRYMS
jgi:hypothetical protein